MLNENRITTLDREVFTGLGLVNLQRIYLKKSNVQSVHRDAFKNLKILIEIDLSENGIVQLDRNTFNGNDRLRVLYLNGNPLRTLQAHQFPVLPHLRSLDLHNCQITTIDPLAFANLELLELLNLKSNALEHLAEPVFHYMRNLKTLMLEGNPWRCDCNLRHFRNWYTQTNVHSGSLMCDQPAALHGLTWDAIDEQQFGCAPTVDVFSDDLFNVDLGSNVTLGCLIYGDPLPTVTWELNGRDIVNDNVLAEDETHTDRQWRNITIFNITNYDAGIYVCMAKNSIGVASRNVSIYLTEIVQHVIEQGRNETFWYFGLIMGTFGTAFGLIIVSFLVCLCKKTSRRRRSIKNIKGSVSFNDQEKKLLDLSITTNERGADGSDAMTANTPSAVKNEPVIALEPVQITIENLSSRNDDFPLNVGVFTPPPEFCTGPNAATVTSSAVTNASPAYGNLFISVALTQDVIDNPEQMYPDLLNIPNRVIGKLFPINVSSYATLPRNRHHRGGNGATNLSMTTTGSQQSPQMDGVSNTGCSSFINKNSRLQNVINYQNLETTTHLNESGSIGLCTGCLKTQDEQYGGGSSALNGCTISLPTATSASLSYELNKAASAAAAAAAAAKSKHHPRCSSITSSFRPATKFDNMGRRITASGNSTLSIPDEEKEIEINYGACNDRRQIGDETVAIVKSQTLNQTFRDTQKCMGDQQSQEQSQNVKSNRRLSDASDSIGGGGVGNGTTRTAGDDKMRSELHGALLLPPNGCDYVSL